MGVSPLVPKWNVMLTTPVFVVSRNQFPFEGRNTPALIVPFVGGAAVTFMYPVCVATLLPPRLVAVNDTV